MVPIPRYPLKTDPNFLEPLDVLALCPIFFYTERLALSRHELSKTKKEIIGNFFAQT